MGHSKTEMLMRRWILVVALLAVVGCDDKSEPNDSEPNEAVETAPKSEKSEKSAKAPEPEKPDASTRADEPKMVGDPKCPTFEECKLECPDGAELVKDPEATVNLSYSEPGWPNTVREVRCEKDGKRHGKYVHWFGQDRFEGEYKDGKQHGKTVTWRNDDQKLFEAEFKDGKRHGQSVMWYESGHKEFEREFKDGKKHGKSIWWYENGQKKAEGDYKDGKYHGKDVRWHENGEKQYDAEYKDDKCISCTGPECAPFCPK